MTLADAIRFARIAVDAPHPDGYVSENTFISRATLRTLLDELSALSRSPSRSSDGPTLRDTFATAAMQAAATNPTGADGFDFDECAQWAYQQADAMLAARGTK